MQEHTKTLPAGMRRFNELDLAKPFKTRFFAATVGATAIVLLVAFTVWNAFDTLIPALILVAVLPFAISQLHSRSAMLNVPLAVDMNHPFMDEDPIGNSSVMIRLSDGEWIDIGEGRVRLAEDDLLGGANLVRDNDDYTLIGHFSELPMSHRGIKKQIVVVNQAIALRDAVNGTEDTIEDARSRETKETGLLDRSWMEEQTEIEIEPDGLMSKLRGE
jgi:hypothetical protein